MGRLQQVVEKFKRIGLYYEVFGPAGLWLFARTRHWPLPAEWTGRVPDFAHPLRLRLKSSDLPTYKKIFRDKEYALELPLKPRVIVDAGANVGFASLFFARQYPEAKILAIEPEAGNFGYLVKNVAPFPQIIPIQAALWKNNETLELVDPGIGAWGFQTRDSAEKGSLPVVQKVQAITLDKLMADHGLSYIDILKIDIEGAEKEIFETSASWRDKVGVIMVELHESIKPGCTASFEAATRDFEGKAQQGESVLVWRQAALRS
ncbi:MAG: FkbM family methyltransferase [Verrucomicrobiae bacterium]|nr:FkbM family methyltransferase [Verrucomicrobiae bacterium]